jgi:hypothetical protein
MTEYSSDADRRSHWVPRERPEWVTTLNTELGHLDMVGCVPLDEASLLNSAMARTGLSDFDDEFNDGAWREPFRVLINALAEEAELNPLGRLLARNDILNALCARLQVAQVFKEHPEIADEEIVEPLLIIGQGRCGSTALHQLMSADPDNRVLRTWESIAPCPPPEAATYDTDARIAALDPMVTMVNRIVPEVTDMQVFSGWEAQENILLHSITFRSPAWLSAVVGQVPSYMAYMYAQDPTINYREEKRLLQLLQWRKPGKRWVWKSPYATLELPAVLQVYPDVNLVYMHRDPVKALASLVDLVGTMNWARSDHPLKDGAFEQHTNAQMVSGMLCLPIQWIEDGIVPKDQLMNLQFLDFRDDPLGTVERIYANFGMELTEAGRAAMAEYQAGTPFRRHSYDLGSDQAIAYERAAFAPYQSYFGVPTE